MTELLPKHAPAFGNSIPGALTMAQITQRHFEERIASLSLEEIDTRLGELAVARSDRAALEARLARAKVRIAQTLEARLQTLNKGIERDQELIETWAVRNRKAFGDSKELKLQHGTLRFALGGHRVEFLKDWAADLCLVALRKFRALRKEYVRVTESLDKVAILRDYKKDKVNAEKLAKFGVAVTQGEFFSIAFNSETPRTA